MSRDQRTNAKARWRPLVEIAASRPRAAWSPGRDHLDDAAAMLLAPCNSVHTVGMRFPIDVVFVDRQGYAVKVAIIYGRGGLRSLPAAAPSSKWPQAVWRRARSTGRSFVPRAGLNSGRRRR